MSEYEDTRQQEGRESVAGDVSRQVRSLLEAAEALGGSIRTDAERRADARMLEADRVVADAEREAARRLDEARREADRLVSERRARLSQLSDAVIARAEGALGRLESADAARRELDRLLAELGESARRVEDEARTVEPVPAEASHAPATSEPVDRRFMTIASAPVPRRLAAVDGGQATPGEETPSPRAQGLGARTADSFDGARQVAFQMAVAGSSRAEVAAHLQRTFHLAEPHVVLNEVFAGAGPRN